MMARTRMRAGGSTAALLMLLTVGAVNVAPTDAAWTESEFGGTDAISAATLAAPTNATCSATSIALLGLQSVKLTWSSPQQGSQRVEIARGANAGTDVQNAPGSAIVQTGSSGGLFHYEAVYTTNKLLGLINLADLLGGSYTIRMYNGSGTAWISAPKSFNLNVILLGLGSSCTAV